MASTLEEAVAEAMATAAAKPAAERQAEDRANVAQQRDDTAKAWRELDGPTS